MASRSNQGVDFNFDGLTDAITNLAGSLILLVVLVFALTEPKEQGLAQPVFEEKKVGAEVSMAPLVERLHVIQRDTEQLEQHAGRIENRLPDMISEIERLERRTQ